MLVGRNVQELDKPPHQEQQAGIYDTRGCHVKFTQGAFMPLWMPLVAGKR